MSIIQSTNTILAAGKAAKDAGQAVTDVAQTLTGSTMHLEQVMPSRPLTHDLFVSMFHMYGIELQRVVIYSFKDGVFAAMLYVTNGVINVEIDSRTSDAIAIALRTGAPIFTTPEVMKLTSYEWRRDGNYKPHKPVRLEDLPVEKLERRLQHYVDKEEYEKAAQVQKIIAQKTNSAAGED